MLAQPTPQILRDPHVEVRLDSGHVAVLRPLRAQEEEPLVRVFDGMSELSRSRRYLTGMPYLPPSVIRRLVDLDGCSHVAWVASIDGKPVGIGRYGAYDNRLVDVAPAVGTAARRPRHRPLRRDDGRAPGHRPRPNRRRSGRRICGKDCAERGHSGFQRCRNCAVARIGSGGEVGNIHG